MQSDLLFCSLYLDVHQLNELHYVFLGKIECHRNALPYFLFSFLAYSRPDCLLWLGPYIWTNQYSYFFPRLQSKDSLAPEPAATCYLCANQREALPSRPADWCSLPRIPTAPGFNTQFSRPDAAVWSPVSRGEALNCSKLAQLPDPRDD